MKIKITYDWNRRDFNATLTCEFCSHEQEQRNCYDDRNYYDNVVPKIKCGECGKSGTEDRPLTKYPQNLVM